MSSTTRRLISLRECDAMYRRRKGTAAQAYHSGQLPGRRQGRAIMVSAKRAAEIFGLSLQDSRA